ncbi:cupredoxin domain-containing protein [Candidatus Amesbacteria bacterium]|nr:cupredoxin domain-containing protein [Candidatus Amesbacteria bacterium]
MNKNLVITLVVIVSVLVVGGVVFAVVKNNPAKPVVSPVVQSPITKPIIVASPTATPEATIASSIKEFTVTASNFKYDVKSMKVKKGDTVKIIFKNSEGFHDFVIDEFDVATSQIGAEEEDEVEFEATKVGTFEYYCSVGKHRSMGMVGKLVVE